jgi:hypothetical protein
MVKMKMASFLHEYIKTITSFMKNMIKTIQFRLPVLAFLLLTSVYSFAQDSSSTSETHTSSSSVTVPDNAMWYNAPWVWVVGVIILILILFAVFTGNNSKTRVTRTTTTTTEVNND